MVFENNTTKGIPVDSHIYLESLYSLDKYCFRIDRVIDGIEFQGSISKSFCVPLSATAEQVAKAAKKKEQELNDEYKKEQKGYNLADEANKLFSNDPEWK